MMAIQFGLLGGDLAPPGLRDSFNRGDVLDALIGVVSTALEETREHKKQAKSLPPAKRAAVTRVPFGPRAPTVWDIIPDKTIRKYARWLAHGNAGVDARASQEEDYAQDLRLRILECHAKRPGEQPGYYHRALYFQAGKLQRSRVRALKNTPFQLRYGTAEDAFASDVFASTPDASVSVPERIEARDSLRVLERVLSARDRSFLSRVVDRESAVPKGQTRSNFYSRWRSIKERAALALGEDVEIQTEKPLDKMSDAEIKRSGVLACYGNGLQVRSPDCGRCVLRDRCMVLLASDTLPLLMEEAGLKQIGVPMRALPTETEFEELSGCDRPTAIAVLQVARHAHKQVKKLTPEELADFSRRTIFPNAPSPVPAPAPDAVVDSKYAREPGDDLLDQLLGGKVEPEVAPVPPPPAPTAPAQVAAPRTVRIPDTLPEQQIKKASIPKKAKPKSESKPRRAVPKEVQKVKDWARERFKSPYVRGLEHGDVVSKAYKGKDHTLRVDLTGRRYILDGKKEFATMYDATASITGTTDYASQRAGAETRSYLAWSLARFWGEPARAKKSAPKKAKAKKR